MGRISGTALTPKEKTIHEEGLVSVLKQLHDDLAAAYGWLDLSQSNGPADLAEGILESLAALGRAHEVEEGRWAV